MLLLCLGAHTFLPQTIDNTIRMQQYQTSDKSKVIWLPDSSRVTLLPHSSISYHSYFGKSDRSIKMSGRIQFDVKKDSTNPFIIESSSLKVRVLGTSFTVDDRTDRVDKTVDVHHGKVSVSILSTEAGASYILTKGQQFTYNIRTQSHAKIVNGISSVLQRRGSIRLQDANINQLAKLLSVAYGIAVHTPREIDHQGAITGEFTDRTLEEVLEIVNKVMGIEYEVQNQVLEIRKKNM